METAPVEDNRPKTRKPDLNKLAPESDHSSKNKRSEAYSSPTRSGSNNSSSGSNGGIKFFDVNDLKERNQSSEKKGNTAGNVEEDYDDDEFV